MDGDVNQFWKFSHQSGISQYYNKTYQNLSVHTEQPAMTDLSRSICSYLMLSNMLLSKDHLGEETTFIVPKMVSSLRFTVPAYCGIVKKISNRASDTASKRIVIPVPNTSLVVHI